MDSESGLIDCIYAFGGPLPISFDDMRVPFILEHGLTRSSFSMVTHCRSFPGPNERLYSTRSPARKLCRAAICLRLGRESSLNKQNGYQQEFSTLESIDH